jgi:integrase
MKIANMPTTDTPVEGESDMRNDNILAISSLSKPKLSKGQQRLLEVLQCEENRSKRVEEICMLAGYSGSKYWYEALKKEHFVEAVEAMGIAVRRNNRESHLEVSLATNLEDELEKDIWDIRRLKQDYPKHIPPAAYEVDFTWIINPLLREQVKHYFRLRLPRWKAYTFKSALSHLKPLLVRLPTAIHVETLQRSHIEALLPEIGQLSDRQANRCLQETRIMLEYMATSPVWTGPRPPRFLIWDEDIPRRPYILPRPIPPDVLDQLDPLLEQAVQAIKGGQKPPLLQERYWDAILILRYTGMRAEDLIHLKAPDEQGRNGCLDQDSEGYWWIRISHSNTKMGRDHRIPTRTSDGVIDAIRRQRERMKHLPNHFGENYLFRTERGVQLRGTIDAALRRLAPHLIHEGHPYTITPHQFRHTIATDMIEQGIDVYTVKEFLGHASLSMTEKYVKVYLTSLKAKYDAYRLKRQQTFASAVMTDLVQTNNDAGDADGGWAEGKVGKLYVSPLPDGIGNCAHLAMLDPCPTPPHCPTCPKLRANKRHLPMWENKAQNLLITVEALRANPAYARARQKHEQELLHAEKVIRTIQEEGFWDGRIHNS